MCKNPAANFKYLNHVKKIMSKFQEKRNFKSVANIIRIKTGWQRIGISLEGVPIQQPAKVVADFS